MTRSRRRSRARRDPRRAPLAATAAATLLVAILAVPPTAVAHGAPVELAFWGDFPRPVANCQRVIGRAAAACGLRVWRARRDCALAQLRGAACNEATTSAAVEAARIAALDDVSAACSPLHLAALQFLDVREAQADVIRFCREFETAVTSLVLTPLASAPPAGSACGERAVWASTRLLATAFGSRQRALDRIAASAIGAADKRALVTASSDAIGRVTARLAETISAACAPEAFAAIFARDARDLLVGIGTRADCLAGDAYAQGALTCPPPICGNRTLEGSEECDDGNVADGDGCSARCRRDALTSGSRN